MPSPLRRRGSRQRLALRARRGGGRRVASGRRSRETSRVRCHRLRCSHESRCRSRHYRHPVNNAGNAGAEGFTGRGRFAESEPVGLGALSARQSLRRDVLHACGAARDDRAQWGRIVTIVSDAGRTGDANGRPTRLEGRRRRSDPIHRRRERAPRVTANNIALGTMRTPMTEQLWAEHADSPQAKAILQNYAIAAGKPG